MPQAFNIPHKECLVGRKTLRTDSIQSQISKTSSGKKTAQKRHHQRHHQGQPGEQQFPMLVVTS